MREHFVTFDRRMQGNEMAALTVWVFV